MTRSRMSEKQEDEHSRTTGIKAQRQEGAWYVPETDKAGVSWGQPSSSESTARPDHTHRVAVALWRQWYGTAWGTRGLRGV